MNSLFEDPDDLTGRGSDLEGRTALLKVFSQAIAGADAYAAVRSAVTRDDDSLRIGNLFTSTARVREIAFVAVGNAADPMASAFVKVLGDLVTQGLVIGPGDGPDNVPFRHRKVEDTYLPSAEGAHAATDALELASALKEGDVLVPLISPGALAMLAQPLPDSSATEMSEVWKRLARASSPESLAEWVATCSPAQGGGLSLATQGAVVEALVVTRGEDPAITGGGPATLPILHRGERVRSILKEAGVDPARIPSSKDLEGSRSSSRSERAKVHVVSITTPTDGLESAGSEAGEHKHTPKLVPVERELPPEEAAREFVREAEVAFRRPIPPKFYGQAAFAGVTLGAPEGMEHNELLERFLSEGRKTLRRRDVTLGLLYTGGSRSPRMSRSVGMTDVATEPALVGMSPGFTDVGTLAVAWRTPQRARK